jgi:hypothetical protein
MHRNSRLPNARSRTCWSECGEHNRTAPERRQRDGLLACEPAPLQSYPRSHAGGHHDRVSARRSRPGRNRPEKEFDPGRVRYTPLFRQDVRRLPDVQCPRRRHTPKTTAARFGRLRADPQAHLPKWDHPIISLLQTSNNIIQKGLAFVREQSGTATVPGAARPRESCPAGCMAEVGLRWWRQ